MAKQRKRLTYQKAIRIIADATGYSYRRLQKIFKGRAAEAIRIAGLKNVKAAFFRFLDSLELGKLKRAGVRGTKKQVREFLKLRKLTKAHRIQYKLYKSEKRVPKEFRKFSKRINRGKNKGKYAVYFDTIHKLPLGAKAAKKLKHENRIIRMATRIMETEFKDQGRFKRYYTKTQKKKIQKAKGEVDFQTAEDIARNIADDFRDQEVFEDFSETFGYVQ